MGDKTKYLYELCNEACPGRAVSLERAIRAIVGEHDEACENLGDLVTEFTHFVLENFDGPHGNESIFDVAVRELKKTIADEAAKAAPQPVAAGDVPEWFHYEWFTSDDAVVKVKAAIETTISRRVAESVAAKDKRIAELEEKLNKSQMLCIERGDNLLAARNELTVCKDNCRNHHIVQDDLVSERNSLRQQLAAAQAEVERLKESEKQLRAKVDEVVMSHDKFLDANIKLREEVSRLSRPVEGVDYGKLREQMLADEAMYGNVGTMRKNIAPLLQAERNSRESAERRAATAEGYTRGFSQLAFTLCRRWHTDEGHAARNVNECREGWCGEFAKLNGETNVLDTESSSLLHDRAESAERERDELIAGLEAWQRDEFRIPRAECLTAKMLLNAFAAYRAEKGKVGA